MYVDIGGRMILGVQELGSSVRMLIEAISPSAGLKDYIYDSNICQTCILYDSLLRFDFSIKNKSKNYFSWRNRAFEITGNFPFRF